MEQIILKSNDTLFEIFKVNHLNSEEKTMVCENIFDFDTVIKHILILVITLKWRLI